MSSGKNNVWKRIFDLWASIVKMVQNGVRSPEWLADKLQAMVDEKASIIKIDPSKPFKFDASSYIYDLVAGSSIYEEDERSLALTELDLSKVSFHEDESGVGGLEKLGRLKKSKGIRLGANVLLVLWKNRHLIPDSWKVNKPYYFAGTVFRDSFDLLSVLSLSWHDGRWCIDRHRLNFYVDCEDKGEMVLVETDDGLGQIWGAYLMLTDN